jgi:hypothetical protein
MPLAEVVESRIVMARLSKEGTKRPNSVLDPTHEGIERTATMYGHLAHDEEVWSGVLAHQDSPDLAPSCLSERRYQ